MRRHDLDPLSLVFGLLFAGIAIVFLRGDPSVADLAPVWFWALPLLAAGSLLVLWALRRAIARTAEPGTEGSEPPEDHPDGD